MERDLRVLTLDKMMEVGVIDFYKRDIDYDKIEKWDENTPIDANIDLELDLLREQELSDMIQDLTVTILKASGNNENKSLNHIDYCDYEGVVIHFNDNTNVYVENDIVVKGVYKYFKKFGINKSEVLIKQSKYSFYWEIGIGKDFEFEDSRISCSQFLLESMIQIIDNNLMSEYYIN